MKPSFGDLNIIDIDQAHMLGRLHSSVCGSAVDGPGLRYVVFMQGCQFQCKYCHNRDSWDMDAGSLYTVTEVIEDIYAYVGFLDSSHGGVTLSGGEPLLQIDFVNALFHQLKKLNIHTCLDTNGYVHEHLYGEKLTTLLSHTDLVLLDIKHMDESNHKELTGVSNAKTLEFAKYLNDHDQLTRIRRVVVPGISDSVEELHQLAQFLKPMKNIEKIELLPYHRMGINKWQQLGLSYPLPEAQAPSSQQMQQIKHVLEHEYQFKVLL